MINTDKLTLPQSWLAYITIILWIVWRPLSLMVIHVDAKQRVPIFFLLLSIILLYKLFFKQLSEKPISLITWVCIYGFANAIIKHSAILDQGLGYFDLLYHILMPLGILVVGVLSFQNDFNKTLKVIARSLVVYSIIAIIYSGSIGENERMESGSININEVVLYCQCGVAFTLLRYIRNQISKVEILTLLFPSYVCVMAGSRMGILSFFIIIGGFLLSILDLKKPKNIIFLLIAILIFYLGIDYILHNTYAGARVLGTQEEMDDRYVAFKTGSILDLLGDRGFMYYYSWPLFMKHPITGIGLYNYAQYSPWGMRLHTEYATQYVENGLLGFIPFIAFLIILFKQLKLSRAKNQIIYEDKSIKMMLFIFISILFSNLVLWSFDMICVYLVYSMIVVYPSYNQMLNSKIKTIHE